MATTSFSIPISVTSLPIPLTTVFTPPSSCFTGVTKFLSTDPIQLDYSQCVPSLAESGFPDFFFTPGLSCPERYSTASTSVRTQGTVTETHAWCCPIPDRISALSGYSFEYDTNSYESNYYGCSLSVDGQVTLQVSGFSNETTTHIITPGTERIVAQSVQIAWQASDLANTTTPSIVYPQTRTELSVPTSTQSQSSATAHIRCSSSWKAIIQASIVISILIPLLSL